MGNLPYLLFNFTNKLIYISTGTVNNKNALLQIYRTTLQYLRYFKYFYIRGWLVKLG